MMTSQRATSEGVADPSRIMSTSCRLISRDFTSMAWHMLRIWSFSPRGIFLLPSSPIRRREKLMCSCLMDRILMLFWTAAASSPSSSPSCWAPLAVSETLRCWVFTMLLMRVLQIWLRVWMQFSICLRVQVLSLLKNFPSTSSYTPSSMIFILFMIPRKLTHAQRFPSCPLSSGSSGSPSNPSFALFALNLPIIISLRLQMLLFSAPDSSYCLPSLLRTISSTSIKQTRSERVMGLFRCSLTDWKVWGRMMGSEF